MATQCRPSLPLDCVTFYDCLRTLIVLFFGAHITGSPPRPNLYVLFTFIHMDPIIVLTPIGLTGCFRTSLYKEIPHHFAPIIL